MKTLIKNILTDIKIDLADEFDRNFERQAFFTDKWDKKTKVHNNTGSLMQRTGKLRRSINAKTSGNEIVFTSNMPYAQIHNEGGNITVTEKMKRYFWAMYMKNCKGKKPTPEALQWKALALKKVGSKIIIPKRQFIGLNHPQVHKIIKENTDYNMKELDKKVKQLLKP